MMFAHRFILSFMTRVRKAINGWTRSRMASISRSSRVIGSPCISSAMIWLITPGSTNAITAPDRAASSEKTHSAAIFILMSIGSAVYHLPVALLMCRKTRLTEYHLSRQRVLTLSTKKAGILSASSRSEMSVSGVSSGTREPKAQELPFFCRGSVEMGSTDNLTRSFCPHFLQTSTFLGFLFPQL
jgi:hypothetical protein